MPWGPTGRQWPEQGRWAHQFILSVESSHLVTQRRTFNTQGRKSMESDRRNSLFLTSEYKSSYFLFIECFHTNSFFAHLQTENGEKRC